VSLLYTHSLRALLLPPPLRSRRSRRPRCVQTQEGGAAAAAAAERPTAAQQAPRDVGEQPAGMYDAHKNLGPAEEREAADQHFLLAQKLQDRLARVQLGQVRPATRTRCPPPVAPAVRRGGG
jgi:hypothetical protein